MKPVKHTNALTFQATVAHIMNRQVQVLSEGKMITCFIPNSFRSDKNALVVGDTVEVEMIGNEQYKLNEILPRKTTVYRGNRRSNEGDILIAANVEWLIAIVTADYLLNQAGFLESAIIATKRAKIKIGIFISKWDLIGESTQLQLQGKLALYRTTADFVFVGCERERQKDLIEAVKGKTVVVVGDRSCGKTALINGSLLEQPQEDALPALPSTHATALKVGFGETLWIDTSGFRDFALKQITEEERDAVFPEIAQLSEGCYFSNCTHTHEDGCQVLKAIRTKMLKRERYDAYQKMADIKTVLDASPKIDYRHSACAENFTCKVCGMLVVPDGAGSQHRNHCPKCLSSLHVDEEPGDRASLCKGIMEPVSVWVRKGGEWAIIHRCKACGELSSNRIAADDNPIMLMSIAVKPLSMTPFPLDQLDRYLGRK